MTRLLGCVLLLGIGLQAQSVQATLLALKDSAAPRKALSKQLTEEMMAQAKAHQTPSRFAVQRFSEDLTTALIGRDITTIRAAALQKAIADVMRGKGSTFMPASSLRETLTSCGIEEPTVQAIVQRFIDIGQEVRGPDDLPRQPNPRTLK
jgi:mannitol-specific phosphotransferase system IIBC component